MKSIKTVITAFSVAFLSLILACGLFPAKNVLAASVTIDEQNFKDAKFREYVKKNFDKDNDGKLSDAEIKKVTKIELVDCGVNYLNGIEYFTYLKTFICNYNYVRTLDLSKNTNLETVELLKLNLETLDLSNNKKVKSLKVANNGFTFVDFHNSPALKKAFDKGTVSKGEDIQYGKYIDRNYNSGEAFLRVSQNAVCGMFIKEKDFPDANFRAYVDEYIGTGKGYISFDTLENTSIIDCNSMSISSLKGIELFTGLRDLDCRGNKLTSLDVSKNTLLTRLVCAYNQLKKLDVSKNTKLTELQCYLNKIKTLDISKNTALKRFDCAGNPIEVVDLSDHPKFVKLIKEVTPSFGTFDSGERYITYADTIDGELYYLSFPSDSFRRIKKTQVITANDMTIALGDTVNIGARTSGNGSLSYNVRNSVSVTCDANGNVHAEHLGEATITISASETDRYYFETKNITVKVVPKVTLNKTKANVICGNTITLTASVNVPHSAVTWSSADTSIATVDSNGKVKGKKAGTVKISAKSNGGVGTCEVTVLYKDVINSSDFWFKPTNYLTAAGVVKGYDNQTRFKPANECTRAQMLTFMWRLAGSPAPGSSTCSFPDVNSSDYFFKPVIWAVEKGITTGYGDGTFKPQNVCTRAQTVTFLWRMAGKPAPSSTRSRFSDVDSSAYYYKATLWASEKNILAGYDDGTFQPDGKCLRRQMVTFLYKYDKYVNGRG